MFLIFQFLFLKPAPLCTFFFNYLFLLYKYSFFEYLKVTKNTLSNSLAPVIKNNITQKFLV